MGHVPPVWTGRQMWLAALRDSMEWRKGSPAKGEMLSNKGSPLLVLM